MLVPLNRSLLSTPMYSPQARPTATEAEQVMEAYLTRMHRFQGMAHHVYVILLLSCRLLRCYYIGNSYQSPVVGATYYDNL